MDSEQEPWHLTIILLEGLRLMRPEKAWRPIVTLNVDNHTVHETMLGVDGQNINQKDVFKFHDAHPTSKLDVHIWHRSQSKKKKRKILVASATHCLGELVKRQEVEPRLEIRLQCRSPPDKKTASASAAAAKGRPQKGVVLYMKIRPPTGVRGAECSTSSTSSAVEMGDGRQEEEEVLLGSRAMQRRNRKRRVLPWKEGSETDTDEDQDNEDTESSNSIDTDTYVDELSSSQPPNHQQQQPQNILRRRRRRVKGYAINSDDDGCMSYSCSEDEDHIPSYSDDEVQPYKPDEHGNGDNILIYHTSPSGEIISLNPCTGEEAVVAFSDIPLPLYTEKITFDPESSDKKGKVDRAFDWVHNLLASLTMYGELNDAVEDAEYAAVFARLQAEWTFVGGLLVALAAVDTAVFSISPDSIFNVDSYARSAIATSSVASGLGIACDAWFLVRYNWADLRTFVTRARDIYNSYFFFSLSARTPALCMFISALSLMLFLALVAFDVWPQGVLGVCFVVGVVMSMQFLVYGVHWCAKGVGRGVGAGVRGVRVGVRTVKRSFTGVAGVSAVGAKVEA